MMNKKLLVTIVTLAITASTALPAFAAPQQQTSEVPVVGKVGRWQDGNTDIENPSKPGSGGQGETGEVQKPSNVTDINVTIPTSMTFDVVTNTTDSEPVFASANYTVTNNGQDSINMTGTYNVTNPGGIELVDSDSIIAKGGDSKIQLGLSLNADGTTFIDNVKNSAASSSPKTLAAKTSTQLNFNSNAQGMADIKKEALKGTFANDTKTTTGDLVLTFSTN
ncbi:hypothetical protein QJR26_18180 (plasmid) [Clostridium baratii]